MGKKMEMKLKLCSTICLISCGYIINLLYDYLCHGRIWMIFNVAWIGAIFLLIGMVLWRMSLNNPADSHSIKSILIQYLLMGVMCKVGTRYTKKLFNIMKNVRLNQERILMDLLRKNYNTKYGEIYNFRDIFDINKYVQTVPLIQYNDIRHYMDDIEQGQQNILSRDDVIYLAESTGTTGKSKILPITHDMKGPSAMKVGPLMYHFMHQNGTLDLQRVFILSYKSKNKTSKCGLVKGPVSSHMSRYVPFVVSPREVYELQYEQSALHAHAVFALSEREIGHMEALMTTLVYSFWLYLEHHWREVCDDIEHGKLTIVSSDKDSDLYYIETLQGYLQPNPKRARELRKQFEVGLFKIAKRIWPNLRFARMLNTGGFAHHANILKKYYMNGVKQLSQAHAASEGFLGFNVGDDPDISTYAAMVDYGFLEFIPEANIQKEEPKTLFVDQVTLGNSYEMVLTTPMGLYRYRMGDVVKIVSYVHQCPVYEFQYRVGQLLNLYWEKTPESVFYSSVEQTISKLEDVSLVDYTVTEDVHTREIIYPSNGCKSYVMFIEVQRNGGGELPILKEDDLNKFDDELCYSFEMYKKFRDNGSIGRMKVYQLQEDTFLNLKSLIISSTQTQQYKVPRVIRNKEYLKFLWNNRLR